MKKVFDQTVRDLKREVNKKVLKVPGIEQKVLDATSNEPWGPHGTLLADIAHATRNYHEYQMIMAVIWKRINDTGKNWRHVYKGLTVLEYLVAHGSERVIDEIREHAYQISTLSDFQYIDSSGRDQGNNVRKKSQSLVALVNDKERIIEVRQKAAANRDKYRNTPTGGMYRPSSYSSTGGYGDRYDDERYEDRNGYGYGREREYSYKDDDRYGRYGDSNSRDGDRYGRDYEERYSRDGYRDDDYRGRSRSVDGFDARSRSSDRDRDRGFDDDGQSSSRGSGVRADDQPQDGSLARPLERKFSEQNIGAPPSYEEAVSESRSPAQSERNGETSAASAPGASSPPAPNVSSPPAPKAVSSSASNNTGQASTGFGTSASPVPHEVEVVDEFDPRGPLSAAPAATAAPNSSVFPTTSNNAEMDLLGSLSDSFAPNPLAIMPVTSATTTSEADAQANFPGSTFAAAQPVSNVMNQPFEDPFGDSPFRAIPSTDTISAQQPTPVSVAPFQSTMNQNVEIPHAAAPAPALALALAPMSDTVNSFDFADASSAMTYSAPNVQPSSTNSQFFPQELSTSLQETDILADILPPSGPSPAVSSQAVFSAPTGQSAHRDASIYGNFNSQAGIMAPAGSNMGPQTPQFSGNLLPQAGSTTPIPSNMALQAPAGPAPQFTNGNLLPQQGFVAPVVSQIVHHTATGPAPQLNNGNFFLQQGSTAPVTALGTYQTPAGPATQHNSDVMGNLFSQGPNIPLPSQPTVPSTAPVTAQGSYQTPAGPATQQNSDVMGNLFSQGPNIPLASQPTAPSSTGLLAIPRPPSKDKFETKSTVWADTLSRGLVNLNISGPKINPLADIGIDFDAINRKEKRMEKPATAAVTSTITMGKAMGSGSGMGRAGAGALRPPPNPVMGPGMGMGVGMNVGMGMGGGPGLGTGMGGYGGMNQPMGMGMGMGMGMNMGMGQGGQMPPGSTMPGGYNPMMGGGGYSPQQPYGGGYR